MASLCQHGAALAHRSRQEADPFRPAFPPRCSAVSIHTARRTVNRGPQHLPNTPPPSLLCSVVQISVSTPPDTPHSPSPKPPGPPANHYLSPSSHYWGPPTKYKNPLLQSLNKSSYTWPASLLMKPDCDSRGSPMK